MVLNIHLLSQPAFACSFSVLRKPSDCLLTRRDKIKLII
jgi:hypothetical protein